MTTPATARAVMSGENFQSATKIVQFTPEVGETGEADAGERGGDEERGEDRGLLSKTTHLIEGEGVRAMVDAGRE